MDSYEKQMGQLQQELQEMVRALPPCLMSLEVGAYLLRDSVVVCDETATPMRDSLPFRVLERARLGVNNRHLEVMKVDVSLNQFIRFLTLGAVAAKSESRVETFGCTSSIAWITFRVGSQERYVGETQIFRYLDEDGWAPGWAWLAAKESLRASVDAAIARLMVKARLSTEEEKQRLGDRLAGLIAIDKLRRVISQFETLLETSPHDEKQFQELFEQNPYLLSMRGEVIPKPFLPSGTSVKRTKEGRIPDFLIREPDGSLTLVEIESPAKDIFTKGKDPRPRSCVTQAQNQVRQWDQIIHRNSSLATKYPGIEYYKARVIIGRSHHPAFPSYASFQHELASVNEQLTRVRLETYDVLLEEAHRTLSFFERMSGVFPLG